MVAHGRVFTPQYGALVLLSNSSVPLNLSIDRVYRHNGSTVQLVEFEWRSDGASAALTMEEVVESELSAPTVDEADYVQSIFRFKRTDGGTLIWNGFEGHPEPTALLELASEGNSVLHVGPKTTYPAVLNMLLFGLLSVVACNNGLLLHASLVEYEGRAVAFTASSGTGKSTQADLWHDHLGAEIMNGDRAFIRRFEGEWRAYGSPWSGSSPYVRNVKAPLASIVVLKQAPENRIRRLNAVEVMAYLYNNVRYPFWDEEATAASLETLDALIGEIPIFLLECRPDEEAVRITRDAVFGK